MKHILSLVVIAGLITSCDHEEPDRANGTYIGGEVINPVQSYILLRRNNKVTDSIPLDRRNRFMHEFTDLQEGLYRFEHGEHQLEDFTVNGNVTSGNTDNTDPSGTVTIIDNDGAPTVTIGDVTVDEDAGTASVPVSLSNPSTEDVVIEITTTTGTAGTDDFTETTVTVTIPAGQTTVNVDIPITDDNIDEADEDFTVNGNVTSGNTDNTDPSGTVTIIDNDDPNNGEITGHIYNDVNGNGVQDAGEPDLAGVDVDITDADGNTQTVTTDADGDYTATVPSGTTQVDVDESTLPAGAVQTEGTDPTTVEVVSGGVNFEENNGYNVPTDGSVTGVVYDDVNGNGMQDAGEPGLGGVDVLVTDVNGDTQTVITDADGNYTVSVPAGDVVIDIDDSTLPDGAVQTEGTDPTTVTVVAGETVTEEDNGYNVPANGTIEGVVYDDVNGNGVQDAGEPGLGGVDVVVTDVNGDTQTVTTDADGNYTVSVPAGDTVVDIDDTTLPDGAVQTEGTDPTTVTAVAGDTVTEEDNGYNIPTNGTVEGHVYNDLNGNGMQDAGEPDLAGVEILVTDVNGDTQTVTTDANGDYSVSVPTGDTVIDIDETTLPAGSVQTEGTDPTTVTAVAGDTVTEEDNGYQEPDQAGTIEGHVYNDLNGNGTQDAGEPDLAGVDVIITDTDGNVQTVTTDANGDYTATVPGNQNATVDIDETTLPDGAVQTEGTDPTTVTVPSGGTVFEEDNGYNVPQNNGTITGHLYTDLNGNGVQDAGEPDLVGA